MTTTPIPTACDTDSTALSEAITGIVGQIQAVSCLGTVVSRRSPVLTVSDTDTLPLILVCPSGAETVHFRTFGSICWEYVVSVYLVQANNRDFSKSAVDGINLRSKLRDTINTIALNLTNYKIFDRDIKAYDPVKIGKSQNYQVSRFDLLLRIMENQFGR